MNIPLESQPAATPKPDASSAHRTQPKTRMSLSNPFVFAAIAGGALVLCLLLGWACDVSQKMQKRSFEAAFRAGANTAAKCIFENPGKYHDSQKVAADSWDYFLSLEIVRTNKYWRTND